MSETRTTTNRSSISAILRDTVAETPTSSIQEGEVEALASTLGVGNSGRDVRKLVLEAMVTRSIAPAAPLTTADIENAVGARAGCTA